MDFGVLAYASHLLWSTRGTSFESSILHSIISKASQIRDDSHYGWRHMEALCANLETLHRITMLLLASPMARKMGFGVLSNASHILFSTRVRASS